MAGLSQWVWSGVSIGLSVLGLSLLGWALAWDRPRGRLRCPKCWYPMGDVPEQIGAKQCPECGRAVRRERSLLRTRRRWRWVAVACVVLAGAWVCRVTPRALRYGWLSAVPTTALILAPVDVVGPSLDPVFGVEEMPLHDPAAIAVSKELAARIESAPLWSWQNALLGARVRHAAGRVDEAPSANAEQLFERICRTRVVISPGSTGLAQLARTIQDQTSIPCRAVEAEGHRASLRYEAGEHSLLSTILSLDDVATAGWTWTWTIDGEGLILLDESSLVASSEFVTTKALDLRRGSLRKEYRDLGRNGAFGSDYWSIRAWEFEDLLDAICYHLSPSLWPEGGGSSARYARLGAWLTIRAPSGTQLQVVWMLRALDSDAFAAPAFPTGSGEWPLEAGPEACREDRCVVVYDLALILDAKMSRRKRLAEAYFGRPSGSKADETPRPTGFDSPSQSNAILLDGAFESPDRDTQFNGIMEIIQEVVDPSSWPAHGGRVGRASQIGEHMLVTQTIASHRELLHLLEAMRDGHGGEAWTGSRPPAESEAGFWEVYDTMPIWRGVLARASGPPQLDSDAWQIRHAMELGLDSTLSGVEGAGTSRSWSEPGSLLFFGTAEQHASVRAWIDRTRDDPVALERLLDPESESDQ